MQNDPIIPVAARAPPLPQRRIPRAVWIGAALAAVFFLLLLCVGGGIGVSYLAGVGPGAKQAGVVGKWQAAGPGGIILGESMKEFKADGTGHNTAPFGDISWLTPEQHTRFVAQQLKVGNTIENDLSIYEFKWHITREEKPVLVLDAANQNRTQFPFRFEGDTLFLTFVSGGRAYAYRRVK